MARPRADHERGSAFLAGVFENADPETDAFMARHNALLERVTVLERACERGVAILCGETTPPLGYGAAETAARILRDALDA